MSQNKGQDGERDRELDLMLDSLRSDRPTELETKRWQIALRKRQSLRFLPKISERPYLSLAAAAMLGIVLGAALVGALQIQKPVTASLALTMQPTATEEFVSAKPE